MRLVANRNEDFDNKGEDRPYAVEFCLYDGDDLVESNVQWEYYNTHQKAINRVNRYNSNDKMVKRLFMFVLDDTYSVEPISNANSFQIGLCDLSYDKDYDELKVTLRRPGMLIGRSGSNINKIEEYIGCKIKIIEKKFV